MPSQAPAVLAISDLSFAYRENRVLQDLDAEWSVGAHGLLGANGSGKTTLFKILAGIVRPDSGVITREGVPLTTRSDREKYRRIIGFLPQDPQFLPEFTVDDLLTYFAKARLGGGRHFRPRVEAALEAVDLADLRDVRLGRLSGGQRQRAFIAQAIVHDPKILLLDEPTVGLDPTQRVRVRELIGRLATDRVVIVSTHLVEDVTHLGASLVVLGQRRIVWKGTPDSMRALGESRVGVGASASLEEIGLMSLLPEDGAT
jgi:ABC-2 type transport system ATP-binding protein